MLQSCRGLSPAQLEAIAELEAAVVDADGGRLKLEWAALSARDGTHVEDLLWWEGRTLVGFLGLYAFGPSLEIAGMVAPAARRQGIATALLDAALPLARERGYGQALLIVPRTSAGGRSLALGRGAILDHSEHALVLAGEPISGPRGPEVQLRRALPADAPAVSRLLEVGFGHPAPPGAADQMAAEQEPTLVIEAAGALVGTVRLSRHGEEGGVYGFVVDPARQGRGIGAAALRLGCEQLRREGARRVRLEVAVDNERALALYTRIGFARVATEDYYALALPVFEGRAEVP